MNIKILIGAGDKIMGFSLPFSLAGLVLNVLYPVWFTMNTGVTGIIIGAIMLVLGIPFWLISVVQMIKHVPKNQLITQGPFRLVLHPIYTSVALLVIPGISLVLDTWLGFAIGATLYIISRIFRIQEEKKLNVIFPGAYQDYRSKVFIPWL